MTLTKVSGSILKDPLNLGEVSIGGTLTYEDVTNVDSIGIITARSSIDAQGIISLAESIVHTGDTNTKISFPANDEISFDTSGHDRIYIKSDGKIGMGTVTPAVAIHHFSDGLNGNTLRLENREGYVSFTNDGDILSVDANSHYFRNRAGSSVFLVIGTSGQFGLGGTNYGTSGQVLTSQGSGSAVTWSTITGTTINNNADNRVITGSGTANTLNAESNVHIDGSGRLMVGTTTEGFATYGDKFTIADSSHCGMSIRSGTSHYGTIYFSDADDGSANEVRGFVEYYHSTNALTLGSDGGAKLRIASDGSCYFGPQIITESDMNWGHDAHQRPFVFSGKQSGVNPADATIVVANPNTNPSATRLGSFMFGCKTSSGGNSGIKAYIEGWTTSNPSNAYEAGGYIKFVTRQSGGSLTEHFKIDHDGKWYKSGTHTYPLVNYSQYATYGAVTITSSSYTDLRTLVSGYTPKKAGNLIVIHHQSQCWQGGDANSNGDAMWRIQRQEGGGSWTTVIENNRIMGNMDGRNYTGGSGLSRHHRTVHLMGSFECTGASFNLKSQGLVDFTSPGLQWYHQSMNILQIWEYEKG